jgi:hypothetical protein
MPITELWNERSLTSTCRLVRRRSLGLPVGRRRQYFSNAPAVVDYIVGGWTLSTFNTFQAAFLWDLDVACRRRLGSGRPNAIGDPAAGVTGSVGDRLSRYFNTDAFAQPPDFTYGNLSPRIGTVRSPGMNNINVTLSKGFRITERATFDLRASCYNFLNHPVFSAPNTTFGDASFGRVFNQVNLSRQMEFVAKIVF